MMAPPISVPVSDFRTRASNCALLTVSVICVCVLVVVGVMIVREYALSKNYINASCRVHSISTAKNEIACMFCGAGAKDKTKEKGAGACKASRFPCLQVKVDFNLPDGEPSTGLLHPDSLQAAGAYPQCSYAICLKLPEDNRKNVEKQASTYRSLGKREFNCYYDSRTLQRDVSRTLRHVILEKKYSRDDVIHGMFWPSLVIAVCGAIFLRLEMKRRNIKCFWEERGGQGDDLDDVKNQAKPLMDYHKPLVVCHYNNDNNHVDSKLAKCKAAGGNAQYISSSLSCLDRISTGQCPPGQQRPSLTCGRILASRSVDALKNKQVSQSEIDLKQVIAKANQAGNKPAFSTDIKIKIDSPSSTGSRVTGIETPV